MELIFLGWLWWFAWGPLVAPDATALLCGRRGAWRHRTSFRHPASLCVAGVALLGLGWLWWRARRPLSRSWRRGTLRGRRGTWRHSSSLCVTGVTWRHPPSFCVAGVALGDIHLRFAWQAWHSWHWAGSFLWQCGTCHTPSFTHHLVTHHLSHTTLSHIIFHTHTQLCHTSSFTHNFVTHHLSQLCHTPSVTTLSRNVTHHLSQLWHTPSFTHNFAKHNFVRHHLCHTANLSHTTLSHAIFVTHTPSFTHTHTPTRLCHTQHCHTPSVTHNFVTHYLSHTHTQFCHTQRCHTHTHAILSLTTFLIQLCNWPALHHLLCLSFLPRPAWTFPLIGRSWLVGLSGPLIRVFAVSRCATLATYKPNSPNFKWDMGTPQKPDIQGGGKPHTQATETSREEARYKHHALMPFRSQAYKPLRSQAKKPLGNQT